MHILESIIENPTPNCAHGSPSFESMNVDSLAFLSFQLARAPCVIAVELPCVSPFHWVRRPLAPRPCGGARGPGGDRGSGHRPLPDPDVSAARCRCRCAPAAPDKGPPPDPHHPPRGRRDPAVPAPTPLRFRGYGINAPSLYEPQLKVFPLSLQHSVCPWIPRSRVRRCVFFWLN